MAEQYQSVGKLGKPHGISGAFRFLLERELRSKHKIPGHFFVAKGGTMLPWFIEKIEWVGFMEGFIQFEEIRTPETAKQYSGSELYLTEKEVELLFKKEVHTIDFLVGYSVTDPDGNELGRVTDIQETAGQVLATLDCAGKEKLIPLPDEFIVKLDKRRKTLSLSLPEGLLDL